MRGNFGLFRTFSLKLPRIHVDYFVMQMRKINPEKGYCIPLLPYFIANESWDELEENPVWSTPPRLQGPSVIERARTAIADLRGSSAAHNLHHHSMRSWVHLPHPLTSWSGTWCGLTSIGSFPPIPMDHALFSSTPSFTHPSNPYSPSEKLSTDSSIKPSQMKSDHASDPSITDYDSNAYPWSSRVISSSIPTTPTKSPSLTFVSQGSGLHPFIQKIFLTPLIFIPRHHQARNVDLCQ